MAGRHTGRTGIHVVDRPGSVQSEIRVGQVGVDRLPPRLLRAARDEHAVRRRVHEPAQPESAREERLHVRRAQRFRLPSQAGCARNRRSQLFDLARRWGYNKVALGHHRDDLVETFFLNMLYSGNISTMVPKQDLFEGRLAIIRPMAYLDKEEIRAIGAELALHPVANLCPLADHTRRERVRELLADIYAREPGARRSIFAALANVREGYML